MDNLIDPLIWVQISFWILAIFLMSRTKLYKETVPKMVWNQFAFQSGVLILCLLIAVLRK